MPSYLPETRKTRLFVQELPDEILVYDLDRNEAHCLNGIAARVWELANGERSVREIAAVVAPDLDPEAGEAVVWSALDQFSESHLLEEHPGQVPPSTEMVMTRRQTVTRLAMTLGFAIPIVESIVSPPAAMAASLSGCSGATDGFGSTPCEPVFS